MSEIPYCSRFGCHITLKHDHDSDGIAIGQGAWHIPRTGGEEMNGDVKLCVVCHEEEGTPICLSCLLEMSPEDFRALHPIGGQK